MIINNYILKLELILLVLVVFNAHTEIPTRIYVNSSSTPLFILPIATTLAKTQSNMTVTSKTIDGVPKYYWTYGCAPTSVGMLLGYYSRHKWTNLIKTNDGTTIAPLSNSQWDAKATYETHQCPFIASKQGLDNNSKCGHVDDYWQQSNSDMRDPFYFVSRSPHTDDCIADCLGTSIYAFGNKDGGTNYNIKYLGDPCINSPDDAVPNKDPVRDLAHGIYMYVHDLKKYPVTTVYNQIISGYPGVTLGKGFTFAQYKIEIDNDRPVLIHVLGETDPKNNHTMLGIGYSTNGTTNKIFVHDTWDRDKVREMTWGSSFSNDGETYVHFAVTVLQFNGNTSIRTSCESKKYDHLKTIMQK